MARTDQLALIKRVKETMAQPVMTRCGTVRRYRDESIQRKLERWLTGLQLGHREHEFWQEVVVQVAKSLAGDVESRNLSTKNATATQVEV